MLTLERARELNDTMVTEEHLRIHALNVCYAMGAMAKHFGEDTEHWQAIGMLHDYDYEKYPDEHLQHTAEPLLAAGVEPTTTTMKNTRTSTSGTPPSRCWPRVWSPTRCGPYSATAMASAATWSPLRIWRSRCSPWTS